MYMLSVWSVFFYKEMLKDTYLGADLDPSFEAMFLLPLPVGCQEL